MAKIPEARKVSRPDPVWSGSVIIGKDLKVEAGKRSKPVLPPYVVTPDDWNGREYGRPSLKVLKAAVLWEYAREIPTLCYLINKSRNNMQVKNRLSHSKLVYPFNLVPLAETPNFRETPFIRSQYYQEPFDSEIEGDLLDSIKPSIAWNWLPDEEYGFQRSTRSPHMGDLCPLKGDVTPDPDERIHWLLIAYNKSPDTILRDYNLNAYVTKMDYMHGYRPFSDEETEDPEHIQVDKAANRTRRDSLPEVADVVVCAADTHRYTRGIRSKDPLVFFTGPYTTWLIPWNAAVMGARRKILSLAFQKCLWRSTTGKHFDDVNWLQEALKSLFSYRLLRSRIDSLPAAWFNESGKKSTNKPLCPIRNNNEAIVPLANKAPSYAAKLFPFIKNLVLESSVLKPKLILDRSTFCAEEKTWCRSNTWQAQSSPR